MDKIYTQKKRETKRANNGGYEHAIQLMIQEEEMIGCVLPVTVQKEKRSNVNRIVRKEKDR